jgi:hypothetical protein
LPIARYFIFVGATLAALLLIADWCLPTPSTMFAKQLVIDRSIIRIKSARKWPEKVVLKTSEPTVTLRAVEESPAAQSAWLPPDEMGDQSNLEALAQLRPDTRSAAAGHPTIRIERSLARTARSKRVAGGPVLRRLARAEAGEVCCQFWVDRQESNELECHVAHARCVVMGYGAGAHRRNSLLSPRTELRSNRLNGSGMNKIVRDTSATPYRIKRSEVRRPRRQANRHLESGIGFA